MSAPNFTYVPAPHERAYYGVLFQAADTERTGSIGGAKAVEFFSRSKVPVSQLKHIWAAADQPPTNALDPRKFAVAIRLIQLEQNGVKPNGPDLASVPGNLRPVFVEGIQPPDQSGGPLPPLQAPPPQQQQQSPQHQPNTPPRPPGSVPGVGVGGGASSVAGASVAGASASLQHGQQLAMQDPYTMTPSEQARYEQLFPEYCKQEPNFMQGSEAVALFNKSGLPQQHLAAIWNMVDSPVDNKLDKLEFAMAMHLIVCVSKKNMPMPPALPPVLKQLKSQRPPQTITATVGGGAPPQQQPQQIPLPQQQQQQTIPSPMAQQQSLPSPSTLQQQMPSPAQMAQQQMPSMSPRGIPSPSAVEAGGIPMPDKASFPAPPVASGPSQEESKSTVPQPVASMPSYDGSRSGVVNAASSSGLSGLKGPPPLQQTGTLSISDAFEGLDGTAPGDTGSISSFGRSTPVPPAVAGSFEQQTATTISGMPPPKHEPKLTVETVPEAQPLDSVPTPQAGLGGAAASKPKSTQSASSYDMSEAQVELEKLRGVLQKLQAENISLKAKMGTMTEEEHDVQKELHGTVAEISELSTQLTTLRAQVLASKSRLLEATAELKAAKEKKGVIVDLIAEASATKQAIDDACEGIEGAKELASAPPPAPTENETDFFGDWGMDAPAPAAAQRTAVPPSTAASTTGDTASHFSGVQSVESQPQYAPQHQQEQQQPAYSQQHQEPADGQQPRQQPAYGQQQQQQQQQEQQQRKEPAYGQPQQGQPAYSQHQPMYGQQQAPTNLQNDGEHQGHNRNASAASFGEVMGGAPLDQESSTPYSSQFDTIPEAPSMKELDDLKSKCKEADDVSRDAEASRRQLVAQMEELRRVADEAETKSRAASAEPAKKKGLMRRGPRKKDMKETEKLIMDAKDKKDALLQVQAQVKDAEALALATKREAEQLRKDADEAQMKAATAASMHQEPSPAPAVQKQQYSQPNANGFPSKSEPPTYSFVQFETGGKPYMAASGNSNGGYGGPGLDSSVMSSGGTGIPAPGQAENDPYSNPFE